VTNESVCVTSSLAGFGKSTFSKYGSGTPNWSVGLAPLPIVTAVFASLSCCLSVDERLSKLAELITAAELLARVSGS
jgi:hypothetical protein